MNDNLQPPAFGPTWPIYPEICQLVRVTGKAIPGTSPAVYPCQVIQFDSATLTSRNREPAYVVEPNNFPLPASAIYDCRLVSAYQGPSDAAPLPLYATSCCILGSSSSSKSSSR